MHDINHLIMHNNNITIFYSTTVNKIRRHKDQNAIYDDKYCDLYYLIDYE